MFLTSSNAPGVQKPPPGAYADPDHPLSQGLGLFAVLNEGSGDVLTDISLNRIKLIKANTASGIWTPTSHGLAFNPNGLEYNFSSLLFSGIPEISLVAWSAFTSGSFAIAAGSNVFAIEANTVHSWVALNINNASAATIPVTFPISLAHYVGTFSGHTKTSKMYRNGVLANTQGSSFTGVSGTVSGAHLFGDDGGHTVVGAQILAMIYTRALTAAEAAQLYDRPYCMLLSPGARKFISLPGNLGRVKLTGGMADLTGRIHG